MLTELVRKAQAGDIDAYAEVCSRFGNLVRKQARQAHLAAMREDAEAEGWLAVARAVKEYREDLGVPFAGYAEQCVKYRIWNLFKRERRRWVNEIPFIEEGENSEGQSPVYMMAPDDVAAQAETAVLAAAVWYALESLPEKQRLAVVDTLVNEHRLTELARLWGVTPQAVYNFRKRGLASLEMMLGGM